MLFKRHSSTNMRGGMTKIEIHKKHNLTVLGLLLGIGLFLCIKAVSAQQAIVYYVDQNHPDASDENPGTEELPWETITEATQTLQAGGTVYIKTGTYYVTGTNNRRIPALNPTNPGLKGFPISFRAYRGDNIIITMSSGTGPLIGANATDYIIWDGFTIIEGNSYHQDTGPVTFFNCNNCIIQNCEIIGSYVPTTDNHDGIRIAHSNNITVQNCFIYGIRGDSYNSAGIKLLGYLLYSGDHNM